ncbi:DHHA1 domain-containing protein [Ectobacillus antri]|jgi:alanyl-tRNA synthetase|uniref:DHHA1 domain-containing protein n=1 Tax=Ectobacillus antri TaxID=2486280 RepID=A0ABT6H147_9BACI|nr:DHHA1 domain-containing protein [Ectobacillus antri]MDG4656020.1 DHHA1 domain-containing protein [Ectobacillus antri]MDG5752695.1 DHHA1 domain-containing protein [Ectobacillus antri]
MTERLYYQDPYIQHFTSQILKQGADENGAYVVLQETAFYPTGGGQPCDIGTLNHAQVTRVEEIEGEIRHYTSEALSGTVTGQIDWSRRFDHMQQHAGQHILSAAFAEKFGIPTISFHLGRDSSTIDLQIEELSQETVLAAEELANEIVFNNIPIEVRWMNEEEANTLPLRKKPKVTENIRIVMIKNFDYSGCGGTHPNRTGEVGAIKIVDWQRHKGHVRLTFLCGWRSIRTLQEKQTIVKDVVRLLNSKERDVASKLANLIETQKELEKSLRESHEQLLAHEANTLSRTARIHPNGKLIAAISHHSISDLAKMSAMLTQDSEAIVLLVTQTDDKIQCICACGQSIEQNMNEVLKSVLPLINGKGGGNAKSARGGGEASISAEDLLEQLIIKVSS